MIHHRTADQVRKFDLFKLLVTLVLIVLLLILWIRWNGQTSPPASPGMDMPEVAPELSGVTEQVADVDLPEVDLPEFSMPTFNVPEVDLMPDAVLLSGTGVPGTDVDIVVDGKVLGTTTVDAAGLWRFDANMLDAGDYELQVQTVDPNGEIVISEPQKFSIAAPEVEMPAVELPEFSMPTFELPDFDLTPGEVSLSGTGVPGTDVDIVVNGKVLGTTTVDAAGLWHFDANMPDAGDYELQLQTVDPNSKIVISEPQKFSIAAPATETGILRFIFPADQADVIVGEVTLTGTGQGGDSIEVLDNGIVTGITGVDEDGEWHYTFEPAEGTHELAARSEDGQATSETITIRSVAVEDTYECAKNPGLNRGDTYIVGTCDTLGLVMEQTGLDLEELLSANPQIDNPDLIYPGQILNTSR